MPEEAMDMTGDRWRRTAVVAVALLVAGFTLVTGFWALFAPRSFAVWANFPPHDHFLHDIGAFQIGIGVTVLLALIWPDALLTVLAGFFVANTVHTVNHFVDAHLGGHTLQSWSLAALSAIVAGAFWLRLGRLGNVVGGVRPATVNELEPFVRQKTISLTTFGKNGNAGSTPVSIAVDGDRAYIRSFENSLKTKRLQHNSSVELAPSTGLGSRTGTPTRGQLRRLEGEQHRHAARLLRRKYPFLHGILVPSTHRLGRAKFGRTVHFELTVTPGEANDR